MAELLYECEVCKTRFPLQKRVQVFRDGDRVRYFCGEDCRKQAVQGVPRATCEVCARAFSVERAFQELLHEGTRHPVCSPACRRTLEERLAPAPARIARLCVANQKGGTGKTTTAFHVAWGLAARGTPTLLVDADPQSSLTDLLGAAGEPGLADVLRGEAGLVESTRRLGEGLHLLPAGRGLGAMALDPTLTAERLRERLRPLDAFRAVVLDPSPAMSPLTEAALVWAGAVLVPVSCDYLAIHGVKQLSATLAALRGRLGRVVDLVGVVPTFFDARTRATRAVMDLLERHFPGKVLPPIRSSADVRETGAQGRAAFETAPSGRGATDYGALVDAIAGKLL